jgi:hypothetical protein
MERLKRAGRWAKAADTTLSLFDYALRIIGASTVLSSIAGIATWLVANFDVALTVGLASWIAIAVLSLLFMARQEHQASTVPTEEPEAAASQPAAKAATTRQAQELTPPPNQDKELEERLEESERENRRLTRQLASQRSGLSGGGLTHAEIPEEMLLSKHVRQLNFYLEQLLALADEGPRLTGWTFNGCTIIGGPSVVVFTGSTVTEGVNTIQGSPSKPCYIKRLPMVMRLLGLYSWIAVRLRSAHLDASA